MRIISLDELPENFRDNVIIKYSDRAQQKRLGFAIEATLRRCNEIYKNCERENHHRYDEIKRKAFTDGFECFFNEVLSLLNQYDVMQKDNFIDYRNLLIDKLIESFSDPVLVERIIFHLQNECPEYEGLTLVIPDKLKLPDLANTMKIMRTADNSLTLSSGVRSVRFPTELICQRWINEADNDFKFNLENKASILKKFIETLSLHLPDYNSVSFNDEIDVNK